MLNPQFLHSLWQRAKLEKLALNLLTVANLRYQLIKYQITFLEAF